MNLSAKLLITTVSFAALLAVAAPVKAAVGVCGPDNGNGCELAGEQKIFLNEIHDSATVTGNVGANNSGPKVTITADTGTFDSFLDAGGGFATIDASHGFKAFNGIDIIIPGYHFSDMVFEIQMERQGGKKGDTEIDDFEIKPMSGGGILADFLEKDSPDAAFQFNVTADRMDELNLVADGAPLSAGFFEIKHLQVSGLVADVPEASTWAMLVLGFGLMGLGGWYRGRSVTGAPSTSSPLV